MKTALVTTFVLTLIGLGIFFWGTPRSDAPSPEQTTTLVTPNMTTETPPSDSAPSVEPIADGTYALIPAESTFTWSGKKPLIDGYINTGSIAFQEGIVTVSGGGVSGTVTLDMNTLVALGTPKKPGQEGALAEHLKGERWFDVAQYPTATVEIVRMEPDGTGAYTVTANLTMHGASNELVFPAEVSVDETGKVVVQAQTEIDRTLWGITAGSQAFFGDLADNMIDDMVGISFNLVAQKSE